MPYPCSISTCKLKSIAKCHCCNKHLCRSHFVRHDLAIRSKLQCFTEKIDEITQHVNKITNQFHQQKYTQVHDHIHQFFNKQEQGISQLRSRLAKMINKQQPTENDFKVLTVEIQNLKEQVKRVSVQFNVNPLVLSDDLINGHSSKTHRFDFSELSSPYKKIDRILCSSDALASNDQYLLLHQNSNLYLLDENLSVKNQEKWPHGWIRDMCWSQVLKAFFLITLEEIFLVKQDSLKMKHIKTIQDQSWQCCTCSDTSLYLTKDSYNATIDEYSLKPSIKLQKRHERFEARNNKQRIDSMEYSNETLAFAINDQLKDVIFVELRSTTTFDRLWKCQLSMEYTEQRIQCCWFSCRSLMVVDPGSSTVFQMTEDGDVTDVIEYNDNIQYLNFFGTNTLVISSEERIHFHQL